MRADWVPDWGVWAPCNKEQYELYIRVPVLHDWHYEAQELFTLSQPAREPMTDAEGWSAWLAIRDSLRPECVKSFEAGITAAEAHHSIKGATE